MILVTVGTHDQGFERLVRAADELAAQVKETVVIQYGSSQYIPKHAKCFQWTSNEEMERLTGEARIVVTHAASGAVILALRLGKPLVVAPRARRYGEAIDDHQQQLAAAISTGSQAVSVAYPNSTTLQQAIEQCAGLQPAGSSNQALIQTLKRQLIQWDPAKATCCGGNARKSRAMRIAMILSTPLPPREGIGFYAWNLARYLTKQGHEVHLITRGGAKKTSKEISEEITIWKPPFLPVYPLHAHFHGLFVDHLLAQLQPGFDLLHLHTPLVKTPRTRLPILVTVHTPMKADVSSIAVNSWMGLLTRLQVPVSVQLEKDVFRKAAKITAVAHSVASELSAYGIEPQEVAVLGNGVDTKIFYPAEVEPVYPQPYILTAGRLGPRKGLEDLIQCAQWVIEAYPRVNFIIAGEGSLHSPLQNQINELGLSKQVHLIGHLSDRQQMARLYRGAAAYVHPSHYEGLPTVLLEAMACGRPVVATAVSGALDVVQDGWNGLLVPPRNPEAMAQAIGRILGLAGFRKKLSENAYTTIVTRYAWKVVSQHYLIQYQSILN
jgi:glycosyltransferase involved in cell wall biosynthesis/UDP-N-acetylglucosamine transferase subunit ALG13